MACKYSPHLRVTSHYRINEFGAENHTLMHRIFIVPSLQMARCATTNITYKKCSVYREVPVGGLSAEPAIT